VKEQWTTQLALDPHTVGVDLLPYDASLAPLAVDPFGSAVDAVDDVVAVPARLTSPPTTLELAQPGILILDDEVDLWKGDKREGASAIVVR
jgi:hypothetical protein